MSTHLLALRRHHFPAMSNDAYAAETGTKTFQRAYLKRMINALVRPTHTMGDIGAQAAFGLLLAAPAQTKYVIDPYNSAPGNGFADVPKLPDGLQLYRCAVGYDSAIIPSDTFDITVSCSVIEHIGQVEAKFDCEPTDTPPKEQEVLRDAFCAELFRFTKPGGITLHTIDHAPRNLTFDANFRRAGFAPLTISNENPPSVSETLSAPDLVRQRVRWTKPDIAMPAKEQRLHSVIAAAYQKPWLV